MMKVRTLLTAFVGLLLLLLGAITGESVYRAGAGDKQPTGFTALSVKDPLTVAAGVPTGDPVQVVLENHGTQDRVYEWSGEVAGRDFASGSVEVPAGGSAEVRVPEPGPRAPSGESWVEFTVLDLEQVLRWKVRS